MLNFGLNMSPTSVTLPSHPITVDEGRSKHSIDQLSVMVNAELDSGGVSLNALLYLQAGLTTPVCLAGSTLTRARTH